MSPRQIRFLDKKQTNHKTLLPFLNFPKFEYSFFCTVSYAPIHVLFGNLEYTKHDTDGVRVRFFYLLWLLGPKSEALYFRNNNLLGFFN